MEHVSVDLLTELFACGKYLQDGQNYVFRKLLLGYTYDLTHRNEVTAYDKHKWFLASIYQRNHFIS